MFIQLLRLQDDGKSTIGTLHMNGEFECFTLEDTHNEPKVYGKTRIPAGEYEIKLRTTGGMTSKYARKYSFHKGMLWLQDVPGFEWVYIHTGNYANKTKFLEDINIPDGKDILRTLEFVEVING